MYTASNSDWVKFIAGDDILLPNCIEDNMAFVAQNPVAKIIFSQVKVYQDTFLEQDYLKTTPQDFPDNLMQAEFYCKRSVSVAFGVRSDPLHTFLFF